MAQESGSYKYFQAGFFRLISVPPGIPGTRPANNCLEFPCSQASAWEQEPETNLTMEDMESMELAAPGELCILHVHHGDKKYFGNSLALFKGAGDRHPVTH
ncbi:MAG: hypothetical protein ACOCPN_01495, partial [Desulfonatronovibrionaceae bacterium]